MRKKALVTGGSHNIGQGIAETLARHGYDLVITYLTRKEGAEETARRIKAHGGVCHILQADLSDRETPQRVVDEAWHRLGSLDLVVCNAGRDTRGSILTATAEDLAWIFEGNYRNYILTAGAAARYMVKYGVKGSIIFITSSRAEQAYAEDFLYGGFKAAIKRAVESIALDLSAWGIRVNCVAPGAIWPQANALPEQEQSPFVRESIPLHRSGTPEDIGEAVAYVASDAAGYVTGTTLRVDGGLILPGLMEGEAAIPWVRKEWKDRVLSRAMELQDDAEKKYETNPQPVQSQAGADKQ